LALTSDLLAMPVTLGGQALLASRSLGGGWRSRQNVNLFLRRPLNRLGRGISSFNIGRRRYFDFLACLAFFFSCMDFKGFFLTSFLASLGFAISHLFF